MAGLTAAAKGYGGPPKLHAKAEAPPSLEPMAQEPQHRTHACDGGAEAAPSPGMGAGCQRQPLASPEARSADDAVAAGS
jgi:hypothetical protein